MEGAHGELRTRLADRLGGDDADRFADIDRRAARQIAPVAAGADARRGQAGQYRADHHFLDARLLHLLDLILADQIARLDNDFAVQRIDDVVQGRAAENALAQRLDDVAAFDDGAHGQTFGRAAIDMGDDAVLRHVDQTTGQVARVRRLERRVGQALARAMGRVEVLEHGEAFLEVRDNRRFDDLARRLGHQTAHAGKLLHLRRRTAGARMRHHVDGVHRLALLGRGDALHHLVRHLVGAARPGVDHLVVLFALSDQAVHVLLLELLDHGLGVADQCFLGRRNDQVVLAEGNARAAGLSEAQRHQAIGEDHRLLLAAMAIDHVDDVLHVLLRKQAVDQRKLHVAMTRQNFRQQHAAGRRLDDPDHRVAIGIDRVQARLDLGVHAEYAGVQGVLDFADVREHHALARLVLTLHRDVVQAEHNVLRRHDDRLPVGRAEDVVGRHHQHAGLELRLERQRHVHRHLVAVEVGVEGGADQRMQLDRLAFDQDWFERLNAEAMQGWRAVQQHRMLANDLFQDVPDFRTLLLDHALGGLDGVGHGVGLQPRVDEWLEQLQRHLFRQAALVQLELGTDHDHRTARIVDPLAEQVLAETALLALEHVAQRLERTLVGAGDDAAAATVVEQRIDRFLQHALLVAHDDVRRPQFDQPLQAVVAVDDAAIEVVEVRRGEAAAVERHQRTQLRRNDRHDFENHPLRARARFDKRLDQLQSLDQLLALGLRRRLAQVLAQRIALFL